MLDACVEVLPLRRTAVPGGVLPSGVRVRRWKQLVETGMSMPGTALEVVCESFSDSPPEGCVLPSVSTLGNGILSVKGLASVWCVKFLDNGLRQLSRLGDSIRVTRAGQLP